MLNKLEFAIIGIIILLALFLGWEISKWKNGQTALQNKVDCQTTTITNLNQQNQIQTNNAKKVIAAKKIAITNDNFDRDQLIDRL